MGRQPDPALAARRRDQILEAALTCFRRRGFHQATMQEICAEARVSPGALYRYFKSKGDIISAIAEEERARLAPLLAAERADEPLAETLSRFARAVLERFCSANDACLIADVIAESARDEEVARRVVSNDSPARQGLVEAIKAAQARGEVDPFLAPERAARLVIATLDGLGLRLALLREPTPGPALQDFADFLGRYLGQGAAAAPIISHSQSYMKPAATAAAQEP